MNELKVLAWEGAGEGSEMKQLPVSSTQTLFQRWHRFGCRDTCLAYQAGLTSHCTDISSIIEARNASNSYLRPSPYRTPTSPVFTETQDSSVLRSGTPYGLVGLPSATFWGLFSLLAMTLSHTGSEDARSAIESAKLAPPVPGSFGAYFSRDDAIYLRP